MVSALNANSPTLSIIEQLNKDKEEQDEKLASGKRINSAADDPAGLQISSRLTSQINELDQLSQNTQDDINRNNVQSGQLGAIEESLQRANVLSIQSGSPLSDSSAIQGELDQLTEQINTIAGEALGDSSFLSGLDANDPVATQTAIEDALTTITDTASSIGAQSNALGAQSSTYQATSVNVSASRSRIVDTDFANAASEQAQIGTLLQASIINKQDEESRRGLLINRLV